MMKLEFTLETITPLFLGGANPQPELRPSSFRGSLRYWYRALVGNVIGNDINALRRAESDVFGDTERNSPITLRLAGSMSTLSAFDLDRDRGRQLRNGHNYLFYSTRLHPNQRVPFAPRQSSNQPVATLILSARPGAYQGEICVRNAAAAVWLLTHLGGLGMRSRRCAGSLQVINGDCDGLPAFVVTANDSTVLQTYLADGLRQLRTMIGTPRHPTREFDVVHPDVCRTWVIAANEPWSTWKEAVEAIGTAMQTFRAAQGKDRNTLNAIFGLPILHRPPLSGLHRRASPLWLRVTKLANGDHVGVATLFKADFMPGSHEVGGGYALTEQFIESFPMHLEVPFS